MPDFLFSLFLPSENVSGFHLSGTVTAKSSSSTSNPSSLPSTGYSLEPERRYRVSITFDRSVLIWSCACREGGERISFLHHNHTQSVGCVCERVNLCAARFVIRIDNDWEGREEKPAKSQQFIRRLTHHPIHTHVFSFSILIPSFFLVFRRTDAKLPQLPVRAMQRIFSGVNMSLR